MYCIGIDIGSTAAKTVVLGDRKLKFVLPAGWNSRETAGAIRNSLIQEGIDPASPDTRIAATGYGRSAVDYADYVITEITCHARGARALAGDSCGVIDVGGQDTKVILVQDKMVQDFLMNDKCSAGTGKFLEIMANRLNVTIGELFELARKGTPVPISSLCTVFAESEVISLMGEGQSRENIAAGVVNSVAEKVAQLAGRKKLPQNVLLTGGLSGEPYFAEKLSEKLHQQITAAEDGKYAGALGGALLAAERSQSCL